MDAAKSQTAAKRKSSEFKHFLKISNIQTLKIKNKDDCFDIQKVSLDTFKL